VGVVNFSLRELVNFSIDDHTHDLGKTHGPADENAVNAHRHVGSRQLELSPDIPRNPAL
jgi:hypothetical protein